MAVHAAVLEVAGGAAVGISGRRSSMRSLEPTRGVVLGPHLLVTGITVITRPPSELGVAAAADPVVGGCGRVVPPSEGSGVRQRFIQQRRHHRRDLGPGRNMAGSAAVQTHGVLAHLALQTSMAGQAIRHALRFNIRHGLRGSCTHMTAFAGLRRPVWKERHVLFMTKDQVGGPVRPSIVFRQQGLGLSPSIEGLSAVMTACTILVYVRLNLAGVVAFDALSMAWLPTTARLALDRWMAVITGQFVAFVLGLRVGIEVLVVAK